VNTKKFKSAWLAKKRERGRREQGGKKGPKKMRKRPGKESKIKNNDNSVAGRR